jgi:hypothetical protein
MMQAISYQTPTATPKTWKAGSLMTRCLLCVKGYEQAQQCAAQQSIVQQRPKPPGASKSLQRVRLFCADSKAFY